MQKRWGVAFNLLLLSRTFHLRVEARCAAHPMRDDSAYSFVSGHLHVQASSSDVPPHPHLAASVCRKPRIFGPEKATVPSAPRSGADHLRQTTVCYRSNPIPPATHSPSHFLKRQQLSQFGPCSSCCQKEPSGAKFSEATVELITRHLRAPRAPRSSLSAAR